MALLWPLRSITEKTIRLRNGYHVVVVGSVSVVEENSTICDVEESVELCLHSSSSDSRCTTDSICVLKEGSYYKPLASISTVFYNVSFDAYVGGDDGGGGDSVISDNDPNNQIKRKYRFLSVAMYKMGSSKMSKRTLILLLILCNFNLTTPLEKMHFLQFNLFLDQLYWLMEWPAGLKLNSQLTKFIGTNLINLFIFIKNPFKVAVEDVLYKVVRMLEITLPLVIMLPYNDRIIWILLGGYCDIIFLLATPLLFVDHLVIGPLFRMTNKVLYFLFLLFRGLKWNPLKQRVEPMIMMAATPKTADLKDQPNTWWDMDRLLLSSIIFTCTIFLYPTIASYSLLFFLATKGKQVFLESFIFMYKQSLVFRRTKTNTTVKRRGNHFYPSASTTFPL